MKIGDPLDRSTDHGPQNHRAHMEKLAEYCEIGVKEGATLVCGGKQVDRPGETLYSFSYYVCGVSTNFRKGNTLALDISGALTNLNFF